MNDQIANTSFQRRNQSNLRRAGCVRWKLLLAAFLFVAFIIFVGIVVVPAAVSVSSKFISFPIKSKTECAPMGISVSIPVSDFAQNNYPVFVSGQPQMAFWLFSRVQIKNYLCIWSNNPFCLIGFSIARVFDCFHFFVTQDSNFGTSLNFISRSLTGIFDKKSSTEHQAGLSVCNLGYTDISSQLFVRNVFGCFNLFLCRNPQTYGYKNSQSVKQYQQNFLIGSNPQICNVPSIADIFQNIRSLLRAILSCILILLALFCFIAFQIFLCGLGVHDWEDRNWLKLPISVAFFVSGFLLTKAAFEFL